MVEGGPWTGMTRAAFGSGGSYSYDAFLGVTVTGSTALVSGVCVDGTGSLTVDGGGTSASFSGSVTCPSIPISTCEAVVFTYEGALLTLSDTGLSFNATGTANGCDDKESLVSTFAGSQASDGGVPGLPLDLRFKAVGQSLVASFPSFGGFVVGGPIGGGQTWMLQAAIVEGFTVEDSYLVVPLRIPSQQTFYQSSLSWSGYGCPQALSDALTGGSNVVFGLGGDPQQTDASCSILAVGQLNGGPVFEYLSADYATASDILENLAQYQNSFVVTALFEVDAGFYTFVSESVEHLPDGGHEQFETRIDTPLVADLAADAEALADAGYIITASAWRGQPYYTLVGTRPAGSSAAYSTMTVVTTELNYGADLVTLLSNGYAPVSFMFADLPDGGSDARLIGEK